LKRYGYLATLLASVIWGGAVTAQEAPRPLVEVRQVRAEIIERPLPLSGRVHSRHDTAMSLTLAGELEWVLEPGVRVSKGEVIARLDQRPILLRRDELASQVERERINAAYLEKELKRLRRLQAKDSAAERLVDESASNRDGSLQTIRALEARLAQINDELRRSELVAAYDGVIAERHKRGGEYARPGDVIVRLVDLAQLELQFEVPVVYLPRVREGQPVAFTPQGGQVLGEHRERYEATLRVVIPAANASSQTFQVRADLDPADSGAVMAGQLVNLQLNLAGTETALQVPRDAIVLRDQSKFVYRISDDDTAHKVDVTVGEGAADWVSVRGDLNPGDWVAVRGIERLQDGQSVSRQGS
jgi:RND family efflux transporter MFP subunit